MEIEILDVPTLPPTQLHVTTGPTLGELAAADIRKAEVFKKYGLDFCCGGKKSLKQACEEKNLNISKIENELQQATQTASKKNLDFNRWCLDFLADYIFNEHHCYWYDEEPGITDLVRKVVEHHGTTHPQLANVNSLYATLKQELNIHFMKEEQVLFPHIKAMGRAKLTNSPLTATAIQDINEPLQMMEADHEAAGEILAELRKVTNDYTLPANACNTFGLLYHKLKALEEDLHQHIHLENNILFPKAALLYKELVKLKLV